MKPDFLFIGPDKTGSTWMYEMLRAHPQVFVPKVKDLYFFDRHYDRGMEWYLSFFDEAPPEALAVGELSHDYLFSPEAAARVARDLPDVRLLTCLRDPADRAFSQYLYLVRSGRTRMPFEQAIQEFPELIGNSLYGKHLSAWLDRFDRDRLKVLWFDRLKRNPRGFAAEILDFLQVSPLKKFPYERRVLSASTPRSHAVAWLAKRGAELFRRLGLARPVGSIKGSRTVRRLLYRTYDNRKRPRMHPQTRTRLQQRLRPDVEELQRLLDVDLSEWLATSSRDGSSTAPMPGHEPGDRP